MKHEPICRCGHVKRDHEYPADFTWKDTYCKECGIDMSDLNPYMVPVCGKFVPDNLRLLERLSD